MNEENSINLKAIDGIFQASKWNIEPTITILGVTYTASEFNKAVEMLKQPQLNEQQQIVLEWLRNLYGCHYYQPFVAVSLFRHSFWTEKIEENYNQLDRKQQAQVLEVFSRWAQEQEEE